MKGIVLAGGKGSRLYPTTMAVSKQLLPIYDKPMIYYPISVLMLAGIREILIITTPEDKDNFQSLLGDGKQFGVEFSYKVQPNPEGIAQAFILAEDFIGDDSVALVLGDNIFYGQGFTGMLQNAYQKANEGFATIFAYKVKDAERFGVIEFDENKNAISIEEKPEKPKSDYAITGLYFYDNNVVKYAKELKPSKRGELEITDLNKIYLKNKKLRAEIFGRGFAWLDTGTHKSLMQAGQYVQTIEENQGIKIACLEEVAIRMGYLKKEDVIKSLASYNNNEYFSYIRDLR